MNSAEEGVTVRVRWVMGLKIAFLKTERQSVPNVMCVECEKRSEDA